MKSNKSKDEIKELIEDLLIQNNKHQRLLKKIKKELKPFEKEIISNTEFLSRKNGINTDEVETYLDLLSVTHDIDFKCKDCVVVLHTLEEVYDHFPECSKKLIDNNRSSN